DPAGRSRKDTIRMAPKPHEDFGGGVLTVELEEGQLTIGPVVLEQIASDGLADLRFVGGLVWPFGVGMRHAGWLPASDGNQGQHDLLPHWSCPHPAGWLHATDGTCRST